MIMKPRTMGRYSKSINRETGMRRLIFAVLIAACITAPLSYAKSSHQTQAYQSQETDEADLTSHGHYVNKEGREIHSPSKSKSGKAPPNASAQCRDGSYSFSTHHRGTCSRHGGVAQWLR
jgi:hypothetical protein